MSADLTPADRLALHEATIARGLETFVEVGEALAAIRDDRLYLATHGTFEDYCRERWNLSRPRAYQLIDAAGVVSTMVDTGLPAPTSERQARELARVPEPQRAEVWRETLDRTAGKPTAAAVREVARPTEATPSLADHLVERAHGGAEPTSAAMAQGLVDDLMGQAPGPDAAVDDFLANDPAVIDAQYRKAFVDHLARISGTTSFDAGRLASLLDESQVWLTEELARSMSTFAKAIRDQRTGLRIVSGGKS